MFNNLFKSKRQREIERDMAVQRVLSLHRQQISKLKQHEKGYMEKAVRAKRMGDTANLKQLYKLVAQTMRQRRKMESQLLYLETIIQSRDRARLFGEFANGMKVMAKSVSEVFKEMDAEDMMKDVENILAQSSQMENTMNMVLDRISTTDDSLSLGEEDISPEDVEKIVEGQAETSVTSADKEVEAGLRALEEQLKSRSAE